MSKFWDWIRGTAAEAESVANQDLALVSREWPQFVRNWQAASTRKKVLNILVPLTIIGGLWYFGGAIGHSILSHTIGVRDYVRGDTVSHKDLDDAIAKLRRDMPAPKEPGASVAELSEIKKKLDALETKIETMPNALEFQDSKNDIVELQSAVKAIEQRKPPRNVTTGSVRKKDKSIDLTDPSTWKIGQ